MAPQLDLLRSRLLPAILTAAGVSLIGAGLLTYGGPVEAAPGGTASPPIGLVPTPTATLTLPTFPPASGSPSPSVAATAVPKRVATRVVVPALRIDLPVIKAVGGANAYPQCDVAMYIKELHQPGQGMATYLYAHARDGMFGPIFEATKRNAGRRMIGMLVEIYTSDDMVFTYEIREVRLDQRTLNDAIDATTEQLWLQTSQGPKGTPGKIQVLAMPLTVGPATHAAAHPVARPVNCG